MKNRRPSPLIQPVSHSGSTAQLTTSAIWGSAAASKSPFSEGSMFGVVPLFTWGARADGFKMASRWWQRLDCSGGGSYVPPTPAVQLLYKLHLSICCLHFPSSSYHSCFITLSSVKHCSEPLLCVSSADGTIHLSLYHTLCYLCHHFLSFLSAPPTPSLVSLPFALSFCFALGYALAPSY